MTPYIVLEEHYLNKPVAVMVQSSPWLLEELEPQSLRFVMTEPAFSHESLFDASRKSVSRLTLDFLTHAPLNMTFPDWSAVQISKVQAMRCENAEEFQGETFVRLILLVYRSNNLRSHADLLGAKGVTVPEDEEFFSPKFSHIIGSKEDTLLLDYANRTLVQKSDGTQVELARFHPSIEKPIHYFLSELMRGHPVGVPYAEALALHRILWQAVEVINQNGPLATYPINAPIRDVMALAEQHAIIPASEVIERRQPF